MVARSAACLTLLSLLASPACAALAAEDVALTADDECSARGCALNALQLRKSAGACDTETPCHGASGEARQLCMEEEQVKCCINAGHSTASCCANVNPQIQFRPICAAHPACDTQTPCHGASGEARQLCMEEEQVKCCIRDGGSTSSCCADKNPQIQFRPVCASQPTCDTETPCHGASGEARQLCMEEEQVKCCVRDGGSTGSCCADKNPQVQHRPVCASQPDCDTEMPCLGASGEARQLCMEEEQVKCCLQDGGSQSHCCANVNPQIKFRPICKAR